MKKRFLMLCSMLAIVFCGTFLLSACGKPKNAEFAQFKKVIESVIETLDNKLSSGQVAASGKDTLRMITPTSTIHNLVVTDALKTERNSVDYYFADAKDQSFFGPLLCGEVLTSKKKVKTFYGIKSYIEYFSQYIMVENSNSHYMSYVYSDETGPFEEEYYVYLDLNYTSKTNFEFVNIGCNNDLSIINYIYGNHNGEMYFIIKSSDDNCVVTSYQGQMYESTDPEVVSAACNLVLGEVQQIDKDKFRSIKSGCQYTIIEAEYNQVAEEYFGDTGSDEGIGDQFGFMVADKCLMFFTGRPEQMPATITLPSNIDSIYYQALVLSPQVQEIIIPSNVKYIKARVADLMDNPPTMINPTDPEYQLQVLTPEQIAEKFMFEAPNLTKVVAENSTLFDTSGNNLYLKANNALLKILNPTTITHLNLSESALIEETRRALLYREISLPNLVSIYEKIEGEYVGRESIPCNTSQFLSNQQNANYQLDSITIEGIYGYTHREGDETYGPTFDLSLSNVASVKNIIIKGSTYSIRISGACPIDSIKFNNPSTVIDLGSIVLQKDLTIYVAWTGKDIDVMPTGDYNVQVEVYAE